MLSKRLEKVQTFAFRRILSLNKPELTSLPLTAILLLCKFLLGPMLVVAMFFANQTAFSSITSIIDTVISLHHFESDKISVIMCSVLSFVNILIAVLFANFFQKKQFKIGNRILLGILVLLQTAKYFVIILVCAQIREQLIDREFFYGIINAFNLICILFWNHLFEKFYFTLNYSTKNLLARFNLQIHQYIESFLCLATIVMAFIGHDSLNSVLQIIFNTIFLLAKVFFICIFFFYLDKGLLKWLYVSRNVQQIYAFFFMIETVTIFANLIIKLTDENLLKSNFFVCVFITAIFCFLGWKSYFDWNQEDIYFARGKDIKESSKATMYLKALHQIVSKNQHNSQNSSLIMASIRKQHQIECKNFNCYCRSHVEGIFIRQYSIEQLQALRISFKNNPKILIQKLNLRFYMFQSYPDILNRLQQIQSSFSLSLTEKYSLLSLKTELIKFINEKNLSLNMIDVQSPLRLQQVSTNLQNIIKKDIEKKSKKWKYLARGMCRIEELQQDTNHQIKSLKEITEIIDKEMRNFKRSILFNILIMFYYKKISFLNVKNDQIQKNLTDLLKKIKQEELSSTKQFGKWIFHKRSCVIESLIDHQKMGTITRSSRNVHQMFGYSQKKLIGMNLNKLMPSFMVDQHTTIINEWVKTGTWRTVGKLKQIFCIHKDDMCFSALIYLKIIAYQNGLFFVGVVFKKNECDYLILNQKQEIEGVGRKFVQVMGQNCRRLPINFLCDDFPMLDKSRSEDFKYYVKEFISLSGQSGMAQQFMQQKNRKYLTDQQQKKFITTYKHKIQQKQVGRWQVGFGLKVFRMRELPFYVVLLNYAKRIRTNQGQSIKNLSENKIELVVGSGKVNENEDFDAESEVEPSNVTVNQEHEEFFEEKNSSMASFAQRQSFTISKLLRVFYQFLITPSEIRNKRINTLNICTLLQTLLLTAIISSSFFIYISSLNQIKLYLSANAQISQGMQLTTSLFNKVMSLQEYQGDPQAMGRFLRVTEGDLKELYITVRNQLKSINGAVSQLHSEELYQYLKSPISYSYAANQTRTIEVLQFLTYYFYLTTDIKDHFVKDMAGKKISKILKDKQYELDRIRENFPQLKEISGKVCDMFARMTKETQQNLVIAAWTVMIVFFVVTLGFFLYTYSYFSFRYSQKHQCLQIYKTIPSTLVQKIKDYYGQFYSNLFSATSNKSAGIQQNLQNLNSNELTIDDTHASTMLNNKIKFIGRHQFTGWIRSLVILVAVNTVNVLITYEILNFANPLNQFMTNVNNIISTSNQQIDSYLDIKAKYLIVKKPQLNQQYIDNLLSLMTQNEVRFNEMVMFQSETLTLYDPQFYGEFYQILVDNVCEQIKDTLNRESYDDCMVLSKKNVIEDGVITYMNYFQRRVRTILEDLKVNSTLRLQTEGNDYFLNRGFKEIDISLSYSIRLFRKLIQRIIMGYKKGIEYISFINTIVLVLLISPQIISLVLWCHLVKKEKEKLSLLYGSILMIPPNVIKHVKNLPRMAKKILEFEEC